MRDRPLVHTRVDGWCAQCEGAGRLAIQHVDLPAGMWAEQATELLMTVAQHVLADVLARLQEITGHGCEAAAARAEQAGRMLVVTRDMWDALGLPVPPEVLVQDSSHIPVVAPPAPPT
jgi:hypothetical protein